MIKCEICGRKVKSFKGLSVHLRAHQISSEEYYLTYLGEKTTCLECGGETFYQGLSDGYRNYCSQKCATSSDIRNQKISKGLLNNEEHIEKSRERITARNKSEKAREKSSEIGKIYGSINFKKAHEEYDRKRLCPICNEESVHLIGIGCMTCHNRSFVSTKGFEVANENRKNKYGTISPAKNILTSADEIDNIKTMGGYEKQFAKVLLEKKIDFVYEYFSENYPGLCDFYLPKFDTYIELHIFWIHGPRPFTGSEEDFELIEKYGSLYKDLSKKFVRTWIESDVNLLNVAKKNNLKYITLYGSGNLNKFIKDFREDEERTLEEWRAFK